MEYEEISPGVILFKNILKDVEKYYEFILNSKTGTDPHFNNTSWKEWFYGNQSQSFASYVKKDDFSTGAKFQNECLDAFFKMISIYKDNFFDKDFFEENFYNQNLPISLEEYNKTGEFTTKDFVVFEAKKNNYPEKHMATHQDQHFWWGGSRQIFNCNIYLNNDYEGGEVFFYTFNGKKVPYVDEYSGIKREAMVMEKEYRYKPSAGDALFIQSNCWHTVMPMKNNTSKYYARQLLCDMSDHPLKDKYQEHMGPKFEKFYSSKNEIESVSRIVPIEFKSLKSIDLDSPYYVLNPDIKVAFILEENLVNDA